MEWLGILIVSPLWGAISAQLFIQAWLAVANFLIALVGFVRGKVSRETTALGMGAAVTGVIVFSLLLVGGFWFLTGVLPFGRSRVENIVYWVVAGLSSLYMLAQIPAKIRKSWRNAMVPGTLETDIYKRQRGLNPDVD